MNRKFILSYSFKNLRRKSGRTIFLLLGIAIANALTIWILTFRQSSFDSLMGDILGMKYGQEQITQKNYYDFDKNSLNPYKYFSRDKLSLSKKRHTFRTQTMALFASHTNAIPLILNGYDMEEELKYSRISRVLNKDFKFYKKFPLILGKRLAQGLEVKVGDEVAVIGQGVDGSVANELFTVERILDLGGGDFEKSFAVTGLKDMQEFLSMEEGSVHLMINFEKKPVETIPEGLERIHWRSLLPDISSSSSFMDSFTRFYAVFFALVASLAMANTLALSFLERVKEYRMCTIIGASKTWLRKTVSLEILFISLAGIILGNIIILMVFSFFHYFPFDLSLLTDGEPIQMGGMIITQNITIDPALWIFTVCDLFYVLTLGVASLYPLRVVMAKSQV